MRIAMAVVVGAACALTSGGRELPVAPPPRAKPTDADWLPKPGSDPKLGSIPADPPSAFPELVPPPIPQAGNRNEIEEQYWQLWTKMCPRLYGAIAIGIEATDGVHQKLLKARLHQGVIEFQVMEQGRGVVSGPRPGFDHYRDCLSDIQSVAVELWANQPKELIPWLEEVTVVAKAVEAFTRTRVTIGTRLPMELTAARRLRLKAEAELWKAKNAK